MMEGGCALGPSPCPEEQRRASSGKTDIHIDNDPSAPGIRSGTKPGSEPNVRKTGKIGTMARGRTQAPSSGSGHD